MKNAMPHLLVVDDDKRLRALIKKYLSENGFIVVSAADAEEAKKNLQYLSFDLIVLDIMMPGKTGLEFLVELRSTNTIPVLLLTALGDSADRIHGLEKGADDYLPKPFEPKELLLRVKAILRRKPKPEAVKKASFGPYVFDSTTNNLKMNEQIIHLTSAELGLVKILATSAGKAISREEIAKKSKDMNDERAVDVQIMRLRKKIESDPKKPIYIQTIRGEGYRLNVE